MGTGRARSAMRLQAKVQLGLLAALDEVPALFAGLLKRPEVLPLLPLPADNGIQLEGGRDPDLGPFVKTPRLSSFLIALLTLALSMDRSRPTSA